MTAEIISAEEAGRIGLVEKVVPADDLIAEAEKVAKTINSKAPIAVSSAKLAINKGYNLDMAAASALEIETFTAPFASSDKTEGMTAFLEKRDAKFERK